jgi:hypothetical protein
LKIDFTAEFCFWTEQQLNGDQLLGIELAETPKVPHTIKVEKSLRFPTIHNMAPIGRRFMSYDCQKLDRSAETEIWAHYTFQHKSGIRQKISMTSPETLNMKLAGNELSFPLVTDVAYSDARFDSYGILKSG